MMHLAGSSRMLSALVVLLLALGSMAPAAAQTGRRGLTEGHAAVIAQGVAPLPAASIAWVVDTGKAPSAPAARETSAALGFTYASDAALMVEEVVDGRVRLLPGEAVFTRPGTRIRRIGIGGDPVAYLSIDLVAAADAAVAGAAGAAYVGAPIRSPGNGEFDIDLIRDVLRRGEETALPAGVLSTLVHVAAGTVEIDLGHGRPLRVVAGATVEVDGAAVVRGVGRDRATLLAALVSAEAPTRLTPPIAATPVAATPGTPTATLAAVPEEAVATPIG
ncbi:MAG: hypothetical protein IT337_03505, partial [Thermomicrobiales bacterium]|nr:hypothetical protein [Thermomicrobiales bacterium]